MFVVVVVPLLDSLISFGFHPNIAVFTAADHTVALSHFVAINHFAVVFFSTAFIVMPLLP